VINPAAAWAIAALIACAFLWVLCTIDTLLPPRTIEWIDRVLLGVETIRILHCGEFIEETVGVDRALERLLDLQPLPLSVALRSEGWALVDQCGEPVLEAFSQ
jgi:hypothetical protein